MLLTNNDSIYRVLEEKKEKQLVIDCIKRTMPKWVNKDALGAWVFCEERLLWERTQFSMDKLTAQKQKVAQERYTQIAPVLPIIGDEKRRNQMIGVLAEQTSKQTIRKYLCLYLAYQNIAALAPTERRKKELSEDEKNMRWGLNKFFYTQQKNSLAAAYTMLLKERYCTPQGTLKESYPSFYQFRYYYRKTKSMEKYYISRDGLKNYQRNSRPLLGSGVQAFAASVGVGMLDATVCDLYLVDDGGAVVGRPILTACVDAYSSFCYGYALTWEGGVYSLRGLMRNVISDKKAWCAEHGVVIEKEQWNSSQMPGTLVTDMGSEYKSDTFGQIAELGIKVVNLPPYRPELKGPVEKFFDIIQGYYKKFLKGKGVVEPDFQERGAHDYRKDACLTMRQFEQIILHCILFYNSSRILDHFPYSEKMLEMGVKPYARDIFEWGSKQLGANLLDVSQQRLILTLLPRAEGKFTRRGLLVNGLRYQNPAYTESYLKGGKCTAAYNPEDVSKVWLLESGEFTAFSLVEEHFSGKNLQTVRKTQTAQRKAMAAEQKKVLQSQIDLAEHIQVIANQGLRQNGGLNGIRKTRKSQRDSAHLDYMMEVMRRGK